MGDTVDVVEIVGVNMLALGAAFTLVRTIRLTFEDNGFVGARLLAWVVRIAVLWLTWMVVAGTSFALIRLVEVML